MLSPPNERVLEHEHETYDDAQFRAHSFVNDATSHQTNTMNVYAFCELSHTKTHTTHTHANHTHTARHRQNVN